MMKKFKTIAERLLTRPQSGIPLMFLAGLLVWSALIISASGAVNEAADLAVVSPLAAQPVLTGQWVAQINANKPAVVNLILSRNEKGDSYMQSEDLPLAELQGLPAEVASSAKLNVSFRIIREAGTFDCEGYFGAGKGAGFWALTPSQSFISAMRAGGYENLTDEDLLKAALHKLTTKFVDDLKALGYDRLEFRELLRAASHEVTPTYIREMQSAGFQGLSMEALIRARNHEIDARYVKEVQAMGFDKQPLESLIRLRNHEITQAFIERMRTAGFDNLSIEELIRLKNHDITPEFVNGLKAEGYTDIPLEVAIRLKNHEVDGDFIRRVKAKGFTNVTLEQLIRLRSNDIIK